MKGHLKMTSAKWPPFRFSLTAFKEQCHSLILTGPEFCHHCTCRWPGIKWYQAISRQGTDYTVTHVFCIFFQMTFFFISNDIFQNIQWDLGILHSMKYGFLCTFLIWGMEELIAHWPSLWCIFNGKHAKLVQNHPGVASIRMTLARFGHLYTLWPSDTIWRHRSGSTLPQVMAWCLTAPNHYQNLCWLLISEVLWHSPKNNFTGRPILLFSITSLVPNSTKPLPEPMLTSHKWGSVAFTWEQFHRASTHYYFV